MNHFHDWRRRALPLISLLLLATRLQAVSYTFTDLGTLGDPYTYSVGTGINSSGLVVGYSYFTNPAATSFDDYVHPHAFVDNGVMHDLGTLGGAQSSASGINQNGLIVGNSDTDASGPHAFLYDGAMHDLGTLGGPTSYATGINGVNQITGTADTADGFQRAFLYDTSMHDLGTLGGSNSSGHAINDSGRVVGASQIFLGSTAGHAFLYDGTMHDLGTLGGSGSSADGINAVGHVVGVSNTADDYTFHGFLYDGAMHDVGDLGGGYSHAVAINASDEITGGSGTSDGGYHAFLYTVQGGMLDLNSLIDPLSGWDLQTGWAINAAGQITGYGVLDGHARAFLLTPVPEPTGIDFALLILLIFGVSPGFVVRRF